MGGVRNGVAEEDWCWDLNPGLAAMQSFWDHTAWAQKNHGLLFLFLRYSTVDWAAGDRRTVRLWVF